MATTKNTWFRKLFQRTDEENAGQEPAEQVEKERITPNPGTKILVVEDSKTMQAFLAKILSNQGYEVLAAYDGESGIELAKAHKPALILMDIVMPGISGFQATREIRKTSEISDLPIILMSGNVQATEELWSKKIGADDFMQKPFTVDIVFDKMESILFPHATADDSAT